MIPFRSEQVSILEKYARHPDLRIRVGGAMESVRVIGISVEVSIFEGDTDEMINGVVHELICKGWSARVDADGDHRVLVVDT